MFLKKDLAALCSSSLIAGSFGRQIDQKFLAIGVASSAFNPKMVRYDCMYPSMWRDVNSKPPSGSVSPWHLVQWRCDRPTAAARESTARALLPAASWPAGAWSPGSHGNRHNFASRQR
jgi:hypothetical protein